MPVFRDEVPRASSSSCATHAPALVVGSVGSIGRHHHLQRDPDTQICPEHYQISILILLHQSSVIIIIIIIIIISGIDGFNYLNDFIFFHLVDWMSIGLPGCLRSGSLKPSLPASCIASVPGGEMSSWHDTTTRHATTRCQATGMAFRATVGRDRNFRNRRGFLIYRDIDDIETSMTSMTSTRVTRWFLRFSLWFHRLAFFVLFCVWKWRVLIQIGHFRFGNSVCKKKTRLV